MNYQEGMKPILFSGDMVRTLLTGKKTETRRFIRKQPARNYTPVGMAFDYANGYIFYSPDDNCKHIFKTPYCIGDILYVRETWRIGAWDDNYNRIAVDYKTDGYSRREWIDVPVESRFLNYLMQSYVDAETAGFQVDEDDQFYWKPGQSPCRWRPSIHMPKEAARLFLKVYDIEAVRLQEIDRGGAVREGFIPLDGSHTAKEGFKNYWESKYGESNSKKWGFNPWVWVIHFEFMRDVKVAKE